MPPDPDSFDLNELSAAAAVTPRTVRYYVQQGLLPSPGTRGPGTRYDRTHLDRLQLIRWLQRQHLPLAEIRRRLETLDEHGVREALEASAEATGGSSALDYVRDLLTRQAERTAAEPPMTMAAARSTAKPPPEPSASRKPGAAFSALFRHLGPPQSTEPAKATRSTWERIPLAADVELHVRRPLSREQNRQVEQLIDAARDIFAEES